MNLPTKNKPLNNLADVLERSIGEIFHLKEQGELITPKQAVEYVLGVVFYECGGIVTYIPKNKIDIPVRNKLIYSEFTGNNSKELARKYNLSEYWICKIIESVRNENRNI